jgi:hypothetical protein
MTNTTIYEIHQSLVKENIITKQRIRECSTRRHPNENDYVNNKPYYRRILRCLNDNGCPICSYKRDRKIFARVSPYVDTIKKNDGDIHLLTFNLRHNPSHPLKDLKEVLHKSVTHFKKTYPYKKYYGTKDRLFSLTQYETNWSQHSGFHYHAHCHIGTTNIASKEQIESEMKQKWVDVVSLHTNDTSMIPNKEYGFDVGVNRDDAWYVERKSLNEKRFEEFCRENNQNVKEIFKNKRKSISKENLEKIVVDYHESIEEKQPSPTTTKIVNKVISVLKTIYSSCLKRYRVIFQVNKRHHLFQHINN